jgi:DNA polymerase III epsilon subunit-like protein
MEENTHKNSAWINWWEFSPQADILVIRVSKVDETKLTTDTGIIMAVKQSNVTDRPYYGEVVSMGPDAMKDSNIEIGNIVYFPPQNAFDLGMVNKESNGDYYLMTTADRIDGIRVKDVRVL